MKTKITTAVLVLICFLSISCSSDDSINKEELLSDFTEPYLEFCILKEELLENIPAPDDVRGVDSPLYTIYNPQNGIEEIRYSIEENYQDNISLYKNSNVEFYPNRQNYEFIKDWLTNKYGNPELTQVETHLDTYYFEQFSDEFEYIVILNVSNDNADEERLFLAYKTSCRE